MIERIVQTIIDGIRTAAFVIANAREAKPRKFNELCFA